MQKLRSPLLDGAALLLVTAVAFLVRAWPVGSVSLWWDELVHIRSADREGIVDVFQTVKLGIPPGGGNAGAVPLDYLLLYGWIRAVPKPDPEWLELYYRIPSLVFSAATVAVVFLQCRRFFDRSIALVASAVLALSISHALYAAEARFYSLFGLMTAVNLYAFSAVVMQRRRLRVWLRLTVVNVLYFLSGLFSLLLMPVQYLIASVLLVRDSARGRAWLQRLAPPVVSGLAVATVVAFYFSGTWLGASYGRPDHPTLHAWNALLQTLRFFALGNDLLYWALPCSLPLLLVYGWQRDAERFAISLFLASSVLMIPLIVELARWKQYYFHPRHALFLWPAFSIVIAAGLMVVVRTLDPLRLLVASPRTREIVNAAAVLLLVAGTQAWSVARYLSHPNEQFARTKALRDFKSLAAHLRERVDRLAPGQLYLLVVERNEPGHLGNPLVSKYLEWYGLDRVLLRGTDDPHKTRRDIARVCPDGCIGQPSRRLQIELLVRSPFGTKPEIQALIGLPKMKPDPRPIGAVGILHYWRMHGGPPRKADGFEVFQSHGLTLFEKKAD